MATLTTRQHVTFTIEPMRANPDGSQSPATVQPGSIVVASSDETVVMVAPDAANELAGDVTAVAASQVGADGNPIATRFTVTADADMGNGVQTITGVSEDIFVTSDPRDNASSFVITFGAPEDKPGPAPTPGP